jgi:hypothetical protein
MLCCCYAPRINGTKRVIGPALCTAAVTCTQKGDLPAGGCNLPVTYVHSPSYPQITQIESAFYHRTKNTVINEYNICFTLNYTFRHQWTTNWFYIIIVCMYIYIYIYIWGGEIAQSVWRLATGWTVRGSNPGGGRNFPPPSRPALGPTQPPIQWVPGPFPVGKATWARRWPTTPSSAKVKERVAL